MTQRNFITTNNRRLSRVLLAFSAFALFAIAQVPASAQTATLEVAEPVVAEPSPTIAGSLGRVPASAGFYFATMNHSSVASKFSESNAWKRVRATPVNKGMRRAYRRGHSRGFDEFGRNNPFAEYLEAYSEGFDNVAVNAAWPFIEEAFENEFFVYFDEDVLAFQQRSNDFYSDLMNQLGDDPVNSEPDSAVVAAMIREHFSDLEMPRMVMGVRLTDDENFRGMLQLGKSAADQGIKMMRDQLGDEVTDIIDVVEDSYRLIENEDDYLMMLDISFDQLPLDDLYKGIDEPELEAALREVLGGKKFAFGVGIVDDLLMIAVGPDAESVTSFGAGPLLIDRPEMASARQAIDDGAELISVAWTSAETTKVSQSMDGLFQMIPGYVSMATSLMDLPPEAEQRITKLLDEAAAELKADYKEIEPEYGHVMAYATLQKNGIYSYGENYTNWGASDGSRDLELAGLAGDQTALIAVSRAADPLKTWQRLSKWGDRGFEIADELIETLAEPEDQRRMGPMLGRIQELGDLLDRAMSENYLPATNGEETAFLVDMSAASKQWQTEMPMADVPLPAPGIVLVQRHHDRDALVTTGKLIREMVDVVYEAIYEQQVISEELENDGEDAVEEALDPTSEDVR